MEQKINHERKKIMLAKEIKTSFYFLMISFIIGIASIPVLSWNEIEVYNLKKEYESVRFKNGTDEYSKIIDKIQMRYYHVSSASGCVHIEQVEPYKKNNEIYNGIKVWNYDCLFSLEESIFSSNNTQKYLIPFFVSFLLLVICRYMLKLIKWVNYNSKKEL